MADDQDPLAVAVDATRKRMDALREAGEQLTRRKEALRQVLAERGITKAEVGRLFMDALRDEDFTLEELRNAGVSHESVMVALRDV